MAGFRQQFKPGSGRVTEEGGKTTYYQETPKGLKRSDKPIKQPAKKPKKKPSMVSPPGPRPPDNMPLRDYSDRKGFEQRVFNTIGGNPYEFDPMQEVARATQENQENLFNRTFKGQVVWADRKGLDKEQQEHWVGQLKAFRAYIYDKAENKKNMMMQKYKYHMMNFDDESKAVEARRKAIAQRAAETDKDMWQQQEHIEKTFALSDRITELEAWLAAAEPKSQESTNLSNQIAALKKLRKMAGERFLGEKQKPQSNHYSGDKPPGIEGAQRMSDGTWWVIDKKNKTKSPIVMGK